MIPIKDHKEYSRVGNSVISVDDDAYKRHVNKRRKQLELETRITALEHKLDSGMALILKQLEALSSK